ncbi:flagellar basal-body rod protein FlgG [Legionella nagasakiensis]|uniref:flagellar basal-body rod protein FlgG n=1 Tax=Legionella nagasakiensis TaxID=535290 RepID=UPI001055C4CB|nr:flagellar basal-body rod protein FlgG [Legionella nagasakiensis]
MDVALWTAKSGLEAHHQNIAIISNNLANANTAGFKKNRPEFQDLPYQIIQQSGAPVTEEINSPDGLALGTGVKLAANKKDFSDGSPIQTDSALDISINGRGFIRVQIPNQAEMAYTRTGSLRINEQGQLSLSNGYLIEPTIVIPENTQRINISQDGIVSVIGANNIPEEVGRLELVDFINQAGLQAIGNNIYKETIASGQPIIGTPAIDGFGSIQQGVLESSNVNVVEEMVNLIEAQRAFEVTSKAVSAIDNMLQNLNREV